MAFSLVWSASLYSWLWGLALANALTTMWPAVAVAALVVYAARQRTEPSRASNGLVLASGLAASAATFSFGTGWATWIALGWSGDAVQLQKDNPNIKFIMPKEGCMLWSTSMAPR